MTYIQILAILSIIFIITIISLIVMNIYIKKLTKDIANSMNNIGKVYK